MGLFGHVAIISTSIGSRQVGARGPNYTLLATTPEPPRGNDQSRAMPVLLTHDEEFETWLRARPTRRSQDGFPEPAKERGRPIVAAQPGSRRGETRRRGEVSKDVIRRFTVPQISGPFHQLESRVLGGQISRPAATAEVVMRFQSVSGAANDHPTPVAGFDKPLCRFQRRKAGLWPIALDRPSPHCTHWTSIAKISQPCAIERQQLLERRLSRVSPSTRRCEVLF